MKILRLEYSVWKEITQAGNLPNAYYVTQRANRVWCYSGNSTHVFRAMASVEEYPDWESNFKNADPGAILVKSEDEAVTKLIAEAAGGAVPGTDIIKVQVDPATAVTVVMEDGDKDCCIPGDKMRYEYQPSKIDLNKSSQSFTTVYEITEQSVFYKIAFQLNSDNICMQVEIDGVDIFPVAGLCLEHMQDLCFGTSGGGSGSGSGSGGGGGGSSAIGLYEYDANKWVWCPPKPLCVASSMKIKMRSSTNSGSRDYKKGIAVRRTMV